MNSAAYRDSEGSAHRCASCVTENPLVRQTDRKRLRAPESTPGNQVLRSGQTGAVSAREMGGHRLESKLHSARMRCPLSGTKGREAVGHRMIERSFLVIIVEQFRGQTWLSIWLNIMGADVNLAQFGWT